MWPASCTWNVYDGGAFVQWEAGGRKLLFNALNLNILIDVIYLLFIYFGRRFIVTLATGYLLPLQWQKLNLNQFRHDGVIDQLLQSGLRREPLQERLDPGAARMAHSPLCISLQFLTSAWYHDTCRFPVFLNMETKGPTVTQVPWLPL